MHGYVPAAGEVGGPPAYAEEGATYASIGGAGAGAGDVHGGVNSRDGLRGYDGVDRDENGDGLAAERADARGPPPGPMGEEEVRRINEERRKRMRAGGFTNWLLRRKGRGGEGGDGVVR